MHFVLFSGIKQETFIYSPTKKERKNKRDIYKQTGSDQEIQHVWSTLAPSGSLTLMKVFLSFFLSIFLALPRLFSVYHLNK